MLPHLLSPPAKSPTIQTLDPRWTSTGSLPHLRAKLAGSQPQYGLRPTRRVCVRSPVSAVERELLRPSARRPAESCHKTVPCRERKSCVSLVGHSIHCPKSWIDPPYLFE